MDHSADTNLFAAEIEARPTTFPLTFLQLRRPATVLSRKFLHDMMTAH
jgi:hypothetical protein